MPEKHTDTPMLTERFDRALVLASAHHRRQLRKDTSVPYTSHLLAVAGIALELGGDEDAAIGALLHDAVEDGGGAPMLAQIRTQFGDAVAMIVDANSDTDVEPKPPWRARKEAYIAGMADKPASALLVSLADKLHNARAIVTDLDRVGDRVWDRFSAEEDEVRWYYGALVDEFAGRQGDLGAAAGPGVRELQRLVMSMASGPVGVPVLERRPRLYLSLEPGLDRLAALEFGCIDDAQPGDRWMGVGAEDTVGLLHDAPGGRCVGFIVQDASEYDPDDPENAELWEGPRFDVPALGLTDVAPNAVVVAAWALYGREARTINRELFSYAIDADGAQALQRWLRCLQSGDSMAHYALGYTLLELGRLPEAHRHLRHYVEIAPGEPWPWCYYGRAAAAIGEDVSARAAYVTAVDLDPDQDTHARELLAALDEGREPDLGGEEEDDVDVSDVGAADEEGPEPAWVEVLDTLAAAFPFQHELAIGEDETRLLLGTHPVPVAIDVHHPTGEVWGRAMVGTVPRSVVDDPDGFDYYFEDMTCRGADVLLDDDEIWMLKDLTDVMYASDAQTRVLLVRGLAADAADNTDRIDEVDMELTPPRTFDEQVAFDAG